MCLLTLGKTCTVTLYFACGSNLDLKLNSTDEFGLSPVRYPMQTQLAIHGPEMLGTVV